MCWSSSIPMQLPKWTWFSKAKPIFSLIKSSIVEIQRLLLVLVWPLMHVCLLFFMVKWQSKQTKMTKNEEHRVPLPHVMTHISNSWIHHISANWLLHKLFSFQTICYQWKKFWQSTQFAAYQSLPGKWYQSLPGSDQQAVTLVPEQWPLWCCLTFAACFWLAKN